MSSKPQQSESPKNPKVTQTR